MGKKSSKKQPTIDPELTRQLDEVDEDAPVQAVFTLTTPAGEKYRSNDSTTKTVRKIVDEAESASKTTTADLTVFANLQSFAVSAPASLVRSLLGHQEIASASANEQKEDLMIRPVPAQSKSPSTSQSEETSEAETKSREKKPDSPRTRKRKSSD